MAKPDALRKRAEAAEARAEALQREIADAREMCPSIRMQDYFDASLLVLINNEVTRGIQWNVWAKQAQERAEEWKQRADALAAELAALRAVTRDALNELWATYGDTPRTLPLMVRLEQALPPPPGSENRT